VGGAAISGASLVYSQTPFVTMKIMKDMKKGTGGGNRGNYLRCITFMLFMDFMVSNPG